MKTMLLDLIRSRETIREEVKGRQNQSAAIFGLQTSDYGKFPLDTIHLVKFIDDGKHNLDDGLITWVGTRVQA